MAPPKNKKSPTKAASPQSAFNGKFKKESGFMSAQKDTRNLATTEGLSGGVTAVVFQQHNRVEDIFTGPHHRNLAADPESMEHLGISAIVYRRGEDGKLPRPQKPGTDFGWKQMIALPGDIENTPEFREGLVNDIIASWNIQAVRPAHPFPRKMRFAGDVTQSPKRKPDEVMLDRDVIGLLQAAFPENSLEELKGFPDVMDSFWSDQEHGAEVMDEYAPNFDPGLQSGNA